ncbi:MAG: hypothetical protein ABR501_10685, partial [Pyrinomonadaceae bacterium]
SNSISEIMFVLLASKSAICLPPSAFLAAAVIGLPYLNARNDPFISLMRRYQPTFPIKDLALYFA